MTGILEAIAAALVAAVWDIGRRFASRPHETHTKTLEETLARLEAAETLLVEQGRILAHHTDKLTDKNLKHVNIPDAPRPGPRLRR